jgi:hypothetical protein
VILIAVETVKQNIRKGKRQTLTGHKKREATDSSAKHRTARRTGHNRLCYLEEYDSNDEEEEGIYASFCIFATSIALTF